MANYFIFGVGGTGSRVIRSLTMLLAAGFKPFKTSDQIFPILIDYDTRNGDTLRTKDLMDDYHTINKAAYPKGIRNEDNCNNLFFSTPILEMHEINPEAYKSGFAMEFGADNKQTFEQWTAYDKLDDAKSHTRDLMSSLYDESADDNCAELKLKMDLGFKGNPNIGSIVFHSLKEKPEFNDFASLCKEGDRVVIVGSLFGGTGSSGIPELVQAIRTHHKPEVKDVDMSVVMVCPYFGFKQSDEKAVRSSIFNSKTKAALNFYKTSGINDMINAIYYVGDDRTSTYEYCEGKEGQKNRIHIVDLVSALSICHFAENDHGSYDANDKKIKNPRTQYYKYRLAEIDATPAVVNDDDEASNDLNFTNLMESEIDHAFLPLAAFALAMRFFHDEVAQGTKVVKELDWYNGDTIGLSKCFDKGEAITTKTDNVRVNELRTCCEEMLRFYRLFKEWNEEFKGHSTHSLYLFDFDGDLYNYIVEGSFKRQERGMIGKSDKIYLEAEKDVAECVNNAWDRMKQVNTFGVDSEYKGYLVMKPLTLGCREVLYSDKTNRGNARRTILYTKLLKVN